MKPRLLDVLLSKTTDEQHARLREAQAFLVENVARYFWSVNNGGQTMSHEDLPNLAPPYEWLWMEYSGRNTSGTITDSETRSFGFLLKSRRHAEGWTCRAVLMQGADDHVGASINIHYEVNADGILIGNGVTLDWTEAQAAACASEGISRDEFYETAMGILFPFFLAISFLHCKNVETKPVSQHSFRRKPKKNRHKPEQLVRFHVLEIEPMKKVLRTEGGAETNGLKKAIHICRGHFKTFKERGLFGREDMKGTFWWDGHVRGSKERGMVLKDYAVNGPGA